VLGQGPLLEQLAAMLGERPSGPLEFAPTMNLTAGHGHSLAQYLLMAAIDLDRNDSVLLHPTTLNAFQDFVMSGLLLSQPHNFSAALQRLERPVSPRDVRRAIEFMQESLASPIRLADVVAAAGIPGRTLHRHFHDRYGMSPMRYLHDSRMTRARHDLLHAGGDTVTDIALRWGFSHLGRFASEYRRRYGETPSQTRRRRQH
jgi:AraC-like DNA-binding protein